MIPIVNMIIISFSIFEYSFTFSSFLAMQSNFLGYDDSSEEEIEDVIPSTKILTQNATNTVKNPATNIFSLSINATPDDLSSKDQIKVSPTHQLLLHGYGSEDESESESSHGARVMEQPSEHSPRNSADLAFLDPIGAVVSGVIASPFAYDDYDDYDESVKQESENTDDNRDLDKNDIKLAPSSPSEQCVEERNAKRAKLTETGNIIKSIPKFPRSNNLRENILPTTIIFSTSEKLVDDAVAHNLPNNSADYLRILSSYIMSKQDSSSSPKNIIPTIYSASLAKANILSSPLPSVVAIQVKATRGKKYTVPFCSTSFHKLRVLPPPVLQVISQTHQGSAESSPHCGITSESLATLWAEQQRIQLQRLHSNSKQLLPNEESSVGLCSNPTLVEKIAWDSDVHNPSKLAQFLHNIREGKPLRSSFMDPPYHDSFLAGNFSIGKLRALIQAREEFQK